MTTPTPPSPRPPAPPSDGAVEQFSIDPLVLLRGLVSLRRLTGMYPAGHPAIVQKLEEIDESVQRHLREHPAVRLDVIRGDVHLDGIAFRQDGDTQAQVIRELTDLGVDSIHIRRGVTRGELQSLSEFLWQLREAPSGEPMEVRLARRNIHHVSLGRLVPLDTRWRSHDWPDAPSGTLDPAYAESLALTERTFDDVASGKGMSLMTVREIVELLVRKVARSSAALGQILAVKMYENLTYCHSVNVATLSLLIGRQVGLDAAATSALGEASLLHDIGKTRIPLEILRKPGALDKRERKTMEAHTTFGAEILVEVEGLRPLTPTVALEHHRAVNATGYPDLGDRVPHFMSQIVAVADIYEAITGARSYQDPATPEQALLILARLAGTKLNTALVKAFVNAVSFFPIGSIVRTDRDELGIVVRTNPLEPLHPVIGLLAADFQRLPGDIDTSLRTPSGGYERHVVETLRPTVALDFTELLAAS
ncbi:MAG TPA: HD-GYP domain-containing protein [Vicinamibacterales bacterium]|nr:HD-GYP domain-containing protein [Vicinamibacterales bacterium]